LRYPVTEHVLKTARHTTFYLACGPEDAPLMIFAHGWPELSISWRHQLPVFAGLGFRTIAPDMRGYGRSSVYAERESYALEHSTHDLIELLDALGRDRAIWVGHDWGAATVWSVAQHYPERCHGVANLCVPYLPNACTVTNYTPLVDRRIYPVAKYPVGQWDYHLYYIENLEAASRALDANPRNVVKLMFRAGSPSGKGQPYFTANTRAFGGIIPPGKPPPDFPRDAKLLTEAELEQYAAALTRNGFFGPNSWYANPEANMAFAAKAQATWRLEMPALFLHAAYDYICETLDSDLAKPMREHCARLTEVVIESGHWMDQEKPLAVNAAIARWLATELPALWTAR
jgi:pimeloyl-ACP methyl ester carboxylesterase